jgi:hypothetical protein
MVLLLAVWHDGFLALVVTVTLVGKLFLDRRTQVEESILGLPRAF